MAITRLFHMKECGGHSPSIHLKNAINYIIKPTKTQDLRFIGGLGSLGGDKILKTFLDTKKFYHKEKGRQGYHFVISFIEDEVNAETAFQIMQEFTDMYLKNNYDNVFAVHTDTDHIHGHLVFNSVNYDGNKYHYKKGDWQKFIQPITNELCRKYNLSEIIFKEDAKSQHKTYNKWSENKRNENLLDHIDDTINKVSSYSNFLVAMKNDHGYEIREGYSQIYGRYLSIKAPGKKAVRTYQLDSDYTVSGIYDRIISSSIDDSQSLDILEDEFTHATAACNPYVYHFKFHGKLKNYRFSPYQKIFAKKWWWQIKIFKSQKHCNAWKYQQHIRDIKKLEKECVYLKVNNITSKSDLESKKQLLSGALQNLNVHKKEIYKFYGDHKFEFKLLREYRQLETKPFSKDIHSRMEEIENLISIPQADHEYSQYRNRLDQIRLQKKNLNSELKMVTEVQRSLELSQKPTTTIKEKKMDKNEKIATGGRA